MSEQKFELKTWADAEVTKGPVRLAMEEAERKKAEKEAKKSATNDDSSSDTPEAS